MSRRITVLYEDSRGRVTSFGPHELTLALIADGCGEQGVSRDLRVAISHAAARGRDNVLNWCMELEKRFSDGRSLVALLDDDRVREAGRLRHLSSDACRKLIVEAILAVSDARERLRVVLLDSNLEHVLQSLRGLGVVQPDRLERAIRKDPNERDMALMEAARAPRAVRDELVNRVPSLGRLRDVLLALLHA